MSARYGLIGLGNVGSDLVRDARLAGLDVDVFDADSAAVQRAAAAGGRACSSAKEVAADVDVLVLSLPTSEIVDQVLADGVLTALRPGAVLVDMSTNRPERARRLALEGAERSLIVLDAPVTYTPGGLLSFVGGELADASAAVRWLDAAVSSWVPVGAAGNGQYVKLAQNMLSGVTMGIAAELLGFLERAGVEASVGQQALQATGPYSPFVDRTLTAMRAREYGAAGTMALHSKDMRYALDAAAQLGVTMPFTEVLRNEFEDVLAAGDRRWGQSALIEWYLPAADGSAS